MYIKPDLSSWASTEALSIHEIACLCIGIEPTPQKGDEYAPPTIPDEFHDRLDQVDQIEFKREYLNTVRLIQRALETKVIDQTHLGRISPKDAIAYLEQAAKSRNDDWVGRCEFAQIVKSLQPIPNEVDELKLKISELENELARFHARTLYTTPMLDLANEMTNQYYAGKEPAQYPKQVSMFAYLGGKNIDGKPLSAKRMRSIWDVVSHPSQQAGGNKRFKKVS